MLPMLLNCPVDRILFLGLGSIGQRHLRNIRKLYGDSVEIYCYRARSSTPLLDEQRRVIHNQSIASAHNIVECQSFDDALDKQPEAAFICTPSSEHMRAALALARVGCHLYIEKPLGVSLEGMSELLTETSAKNLVVSIGYQMRHHPAVVKLKEWISSKEIGSLLSVNIVHGEHVKNFHPYESYRDFYVGNARLGGGVIFTQIHEINYALAFFGPPEKVYAIGGKLSDLDMDVEDSATLILSYPRDGGCLPVTISLDFACEPARRAISIVGEHGVIDTDFYGERTATAENWKTGWTEELRFESLELNLLFENILKEFFFKIAKNDTGTLSLQGAIDDVRVALAALNSLKTGLPQALPNLG